MGNKRKERPCDSVPTDRRCRVCCNPRYKMPCEGPLPETSEAEPSRSCSSPISESTSAVTTRSGRIVIEPIRLAEDDDYVEQLGRLRDQRDQPWKAPDHVTKDDQFVADGRNGRAARAIDQGARRIAHGHGHTHAPDEGKGAHLKAINGKLIAAETSLEKLRDKETSSSHGRRRS